MQYVITKTGLDLFDTARAWGLAAFVSTLTQGPVRLCDEVASFRVEPEDPISTPDVTGLLGLIPAENDGSWSFVFTTLGANERSKKVRLLRETLTTLATEPARVSQIFSGAGETLVFTGSGGESLPGALDPAGFKGVRQKTRARYGEDQLKVDLIQWAVACLGMALCGSYRRIQSGGVSRTLVLLPVPLDVRVNQAAEISELARCARGSNYLSAAVMAAHAAVNLAERLRKRVAATGQLQDRFSEIIFFELFRTGNQPKPAQGNRVRLDRLLDIVRNSPDEAEAIFTWLDYCFRRGAVRGTEELALAATALVFHWDLESYERLVRSFVRLLATNEIKNENRPPEKVVKEVTGYVTV
ncbi:MAG: hypothetical protein RMJ05_09345 [Thermomicrobium sp.]|nr:hypothetical protein [Thermomicrobium sp.]